MGNVALTRFNFAWSNFALLVDFAMPYGKKQMSDFYPEPEEFPNHGQDRAATGHDPTSEAVNTPTLERAVTDDMPSPSESGGPRRGRYMEAEETPSPYRETDKDENIACKI